jgi:1-phosphofructokinase family hexose kinase
VALNPSVDKTFYFDGNIMLGRLNRATDVRTTIGGKGVNVSRLLKISNVDAVLLGFCGGANGHWLTRKLNAIGIRQNFTATSCETRLNVKLITDNGQYTDIDERGGPILPAELQQFMSTLSLLRDTSVIDLLFLCGSVPRGIDSKVYQDILEMFTGTDTKIIMDTDGTTLTTLLSLSVNQPFLIKPNQYEFELLVEKKYDLDNNYAAAIGRIINDAQEASQKYNTRILLTLGRHGAVYAYYDYVKFVAAPEVVARSFTSAGDTFLACFVMAYFGLIDKIPQKNLDTALSFAVSGAIAKIECKADIFPTYPELFKYIKL